jgi:hypothetical protein
MRLYGKRKRRQRHFGSHAFLNKDKDKDKTSQRRCGAYPLLGGSRWKGLRNFFVPGDHPEVFAISLLC